MSRLSDLLLCWFYKNKRELPWRKDKEPYHVWLSEIMLQQTRVEAVKDFYVRFIEELPTIKALSECSDDKLLKLWEGLGYYNRARNLKLAATTVMTDYHGVFPTELEEIKKLKGIGEYTAGAIASICYDKKTPAVDGNVLRVLSRVYNDRDNIDLESTKKKYRERLCSLYPEEHCGDFTQALMELGALVCIPVGIPKCGQCPLKELCRAHINGTVHLLPVRKAKKQRSQKDITVFILTFEDGENLSYAIRKRTEKGLLHGLYEFYNVQGKLNANGAMEYLRSQGIHADNLMKEVKYRHVFTHVEWNMTAYYVTCRDKKEDMLWVPYQELTGTYALPTAFSIFIKD